MGYRRLPAGLWVVLALAAAGSAARAEPVDWEYHAGEISINLAPGSSPHLSGTFPVWTGTGYANAGVIFAGGGPLMLLGELVPFYDIPAGDPAYGLRLPLAANTYTLMIALLDVDSGSVGTVNFAGRLSGTIGPTYAELFNEFDGPTTQPLRLGRARYEVTVEADVYGTSLVPPPVDPLHHIRAGYFRADVRVVAQAPEPGGLVLALCGLAGVGLMACRGRRLRAQTIDSSPSKPSFPLCPAGGEGWLGYARGRPSVWCGVRPASHSRQL